MDPLLLDIPQQILTNRLLIRAPRPGDGPELNAAIRESAAELRWMPWATPLPSVEDSEAHSRRAAARFLAREDLPYRAFLKGKDTFVLGTGLHRIDWTVRRFEIGYWVRTPFAGRGYVTEAVGALTAMAFATLGAERVEIRMDDRNLRSRGVPERLGYVLEGILRRDSRGPDGSLRDTRVYSTIRSDRGHPRPTVATPHATSPP